MFSMILQKGPPQAPRLSIWIVAQRTLLPPFESNRKTRHYEHALDFYGHFIYSCVSMFSFFMCIYIYYPFSEKTPYLFLKNSDHSYKLYFSSILFVSFFLMLYIYMYLFIFVYFCLFFSIVFYFFLTSAEFP